MVLLNRRRNKFRTLIYVILCLAIIIFTSKFTMRKLFKNYENIKYIGNQKKIYNPVEVVNGFVSLSDNNRGPITVNKELDDGTKFNIYSMVKKHSENTIRLSGVNLNQNVAIVMYSENVKVNSYLENAISELYQYANIYGYKFIFNNQRYDRERESFYMKIHVLTEAVLQGLKEKEYEWIFWADGDVILANPNIRLESFLPRNQDIHLIAADRNGLNAGVFFIRVHPWTLNFLLRAGSYAYYKNNTYYRYGEEAGINNVLVEYKEDKHYVIVPPSWFNQYPEKRRKGDFLLHFCYRKHESTSKAEDIRKELKDDSSYTKAKDTEQMRDEVLDYYNLPRRRQLKISLRNPN